MSLGTRGRASSSPSYAIAAALVALAALFLAVTVTPLANNDIWLHLTNGRLVLENGEVPKTDPYSFTAGGDRFYAHEWLAGVIFEEVHRAFGITGLILLKPLLGGAALLLCAMAARRLRAGALTVVACTGLCLAIATSRFVERPELFSYALTGLYLFVLAREQGRLAGEPAESFSKPIRPLLLFRQSGLWMLVLPQWLWVQLHGYFLSGLALTGLFLGGEVARRLVLDRGSRLLTPRLVSGCFAFAAMAAVGVANPNGIEIYRFPFTVVRTDLFMRSVFEWTPTFTTDLVRPLPLFTLFCLWLALLAVSCLESQALLRTSALWRGAALTGLGFLAVLRFAPALPTPLSLRDSVWSESPLRLLVTFLGRPDAERALGALSSLLGAVGLFGFLWLALAALVFLCWRRPALAGIPILVTTLFFVFRGAGRYGPILSIVLVGGALLYAVVRRALPPWQAAVALFFLALAGQQNRNIVNFTLVTLPILAATLTRLCFALSRVEPEPSPARSAPPTRSNPFSNRARVGSAAVLALVFLGATVYASEAGWPYAPQYRKRPGLGVDRRFPAGAVAYVRARGIQGNVFNTYFNGAYLIHELYPSTRVFVDSRMDVYGAERLERYYAALGDPAAAARVFAKDPIDYVVLDYTFPPGGEREKGIFAFLSSSPDWALVYFDDAAVVYVRAVPGNAAWVGHDRYLLVNPALYRPGAMARLDAAANDRYREEVERAVAGAPGSSVARLMKCEVLASQGRPAEALDLVDAILRDDPANAYVAIVGARLARRGGESERALGYYRRAVRLLPEVADLRREMDGA